MSRLTEVVAMAGLLSLAGTAEAGERVPTTTRVSGGAHPQAPDRIAEHIEKLPGVLMSKVSHGSGERSILVAFDPTRVTPQLEAQIRGLAGSTQLKFAPMRPTPAQSAREIEKIAGVVHAHYVDDGAAAPSFVVALEGQIRSLTGSARVRFAPVSVSSEVSR